MVQADIYTKSEEYDWYSIDGLCFINKEGIFCETSLSENKIIKINNIDKIKIITQVRLNSKNKIKRKQSNYALKFIAKEGSNYYLHFRTNEYETILKFVYYIKLYHKYHSHIDLKSNFDLYNKIYEEMMNNDKLKREILSEVIYDHFLDENIFSIEKMEDLLLTLAKDNKKLGKWNDRIMKLLE